LRGTASWLRNWGILFRFNLIHFVSVANPDMDFSGNVARCFSKGAVHRGAASGPDENRNIPRRRFFFEAAGGGWRFRWRMRFRGLPVGRAFLNEIRTWPLVAVHPGSGQREEETGRADVGGVVAVPESVPDVHLLLGGRRASGRLERRSGRCRRRGSR